MPAALSASGDDTALAAAAAAAFIFSPYKDTGISMNWNTNVISTAVTGSSVSLVDDMKANGAKTVTLAFATGECGSETWGGLGGTTLPAANVARLNSAGIKYVVSTGGAAGVFSCGSDAGMEAFISRWAGPNIIGIDFDIEGGQSQATINSLVTRIKNAHTKHPSQRFSLTLATLALNNGASSAQSLGKNQPTSFNILGDWTLAAVKSILGFNGTASTWPSYLTVNLMTMDYGAPSKNVCVVSGGLCQMGQSAIQAALNLHDRLAVPYSGIELTPMIGGNDAQDEVFWLSDVDTVAAWVKAHGIAGVHYWSYDRDRDCPRGPASPTCNSRGAAGTHAYLKRWIADGI
jgi:chitinase